MGHYSGQDLFASSAEVFSVSELAVRVRSLLEERFGLVRVSGELSGLSVAASGHAYFSLKDERTSFPAVMFRQAVNRAGALPAEGEEVECLGRLTLYQARGRAQLVVESMTARGAGLLGQRFLRLKAKLTEEGLFAPERKRPLPLLPKGIGVVTSPTGAAIRDILKILDQRFPSVPVLIYPARVQGAGAAAEIVRGIERLGDGGECDVLIVGRGGGSLEDLWAFNEEEVVRAVVASSVPVISAVGHEIDLVLSDLAADVRAPTPTAAAEMVVPDREQLREQWARRSEALARGLRLRLVEARRHLAEMSHRMRDPRWVLAAHRMRLDDIVRSGQTALAGRLAHARRALGDRRLELAAHDPRPTLSLARSRLDNGNRRLHRALDASLRERRLQLDSGRAMLSKLNPLSVLARGYSVVSRADGRVVHHSSELAIGDSIAVRLAQGSFRGTVDQVSEPESKEPHD